MDNNGLRNLLGQNSCQPHCEYKHCISERYNCLRMIKFEEQVRQWHKRETSKYRKKIVAEIREAFNKFPMDIVCLTLHGKSIVETILKKAEKAGIKHV